MTIQDKVQAAVDAVCPNQGISFGRLNDKATWRVQFKDEATAQQRAAAQAVIDSFQYDEVKERAIETVKTRLAQIDAASIRALREWVAKQPDAPQFLKDREAEAVAEREKLK